ncbi:MAG: hypothetical protein HQM08_08195 [Candidatus Riflebacteria bacterium]|nr:hypothetical protein [Candidatus Riflebacteria bacterium]
MQRFEKPFRKHSFSWLDLRLGFTLIEIMFSFLILVVAVLAACGIINFGHKGTKKDFRNVRALQLLESRMNEVLQLSYSTISNSFAGTTGTFNASSSAIPGIELGDDGTGENLLKVSLKFTRIPITFGYSPIDITNPNYISIATQTWTFLPETTTGGYFPDKIIRAEITVAWLEEYVKVPRLMNAFTYIVDLEN